MLPRLTLARAFGLSQLAAVGLLFDCAARAQTYTVGTLAGNAGASGRADGTGTAAQFSGPRGVAVDGNFNVYVADFQNHTIRKITPAGVVTTLAGSAGLSGAADGAGSAARFYGPTGVAAHASGDLYVADEANHTIRRITPAGIVSTLAGRAGSAGNVDGTGDAARFNGNFITRDFGLAVDRAGNVYVADSGAHTLRKITPAGVVTTFAGSVGRTGTADGTGGAARFDNPKCVATDGAGNVYVSDSYNHTIRKVTPAGVVTTLAGSAGYAGSADGAGAAARFSLPSGVAVDASGHVFVADGGNHTIRKITPAGVVTTVAGTAGRIGADDGVGGAARFNFPYGIAVDAAGDFYVSDGFRRIRKGISSATPVPAIATQPAGRAVASGGRVGLSVMAVGPNLGYQWQLNGADLAGATTSSLTLAAVQPGATGDYTVTISNAAGRVTSHAANVTILPGRLINLSVLTPIASGDALTVGTVIGGKGVTGAMPLLIRAGGPSLAALGVGSPLGDPRLEVFSAANAVVAANDNWGGTAELSALVAQLGAFPFGSAASRDAAVVFGPNVTAPPASYTVQVTGVDGASGPAIAEVYDGVPAATLDATTPRLINLSVLKQIPADGTLTAGFVIGGTMAKQVLLRAIGPTLAAPPFNVAGAMPNPSITLFGAGGTALAANDDWAGDATLAAGFAGAGAFVLPASSRDAALLVTLAPGNYTAQVAPSTAAGAAAGGAALVEVYDLDGGAAPTIAAAPRNLGASAGSTVVLAVTAIGATSFQWQRLPAGSSTWESLTEGNGFFGTATASLLASASATRSGDQFRVAVGNSAGVVRSSPMEITLAAAPSGISVTGFAPPSAPPLSTITVPAAGLTADAITFVEFLQPSGAVIAQVPPVAVTASSVAVALPAIFDGVNLAGGTVSARIVQLVGGRALSSNTFVAAQLQAPPASRLSAGALALALLQAQLAETRSSLAAFSPTAVDRAATRALLEASIQSLESSVADVQRAIASGNATFTVGTGPGSAVTLTQRDLQALDNFLLAGLQAIATSTSVAASGRERLVAAAPGPIQISATDLSQAVVMGNSAILDARGRDFVAALRSASPENNWVAVGGVTGVALGAVGVVLALPAGSVALLGASGLALGAGLKALAIWLGGVGLPQLPTANGSPFPTPPPPNPVLAWNRLLQALGAPGNTPAQVVHVLAETNRTGTSGLAEALTFGADGDYLRLASREHHGATGFAIASAWGRTNGPFVDAGRFAVPRPSSSDPAERFNVQTALYYPFEPPVTLTAVPLGNSVFAGWRLHAAILDLPPTAAARPEAFFSAGRDPSLKLRMARHGIFAIASFDRAYTLTLGTNTLAASATEPARAADVIGGTEGSIVRTPDPATYLRASGTTPPSYLHGETVTLEARPAAGYAFANWSGDLSGTENPTRLEITRDLRVTANFRRPSATPIPPAPLGLSATAGDRQVALRWNAVTGAASYRVKFGVNRGGPYVTVATVSGTSFTHTELANGITHYYVVTAVNSVGESVNSNEVSATPTAGGGGTGGAIASPQFDGIWRCTFSSARFSDGVNYAGGSFSFTVSRGVLMLVDNWIGASTNPTSTDAGTVTASLSTSGVLTIIGQKTTAAGDTYTSTYTGTLTTAGTATGSWTFSQQTGGRVVRTATGMWSGRR